jgi:murein DD-endopeptidase MepM/ murein hydrolase activator NlpD
MRILLVLLFLVAVIAGAVWIYAGNAEGPTIEIGGSQQIGQVGDLTVAIDTPGGALRRIEVHLEQSGRSTELFDAAPRDGMVDVPESGTPLADASDASDASDGPALAREGPDRLRLSRSIGKRTIPELESGQAQIVVTAVRPVLFGLREATATVSREIEVRLTPPQLAVLSRFHFINHGGSEMVVYRVTPADADSGVRVGEHDYPGFPATGAGISDGDPALRVAFFALLPDQDAKTPISLYARDAIGNEGMGTFEYRVFPKAFRNSQIVLSESFLARVVPAILQNETELDVPDPTNLLEAYLRINRDLRSLNNKTIASLAGQTAPELLWRGRFKQFINSAVEAGFADKRVYLYQGRIVDRQVHLGFDLASTAAAPVRAANRGRVIHAGWLGIYGQCVILDHGMGLQSLYAHLSSIDVEPGDLVELDGVLGRSGATGLAGGDHLHFTMMLAGNPVTAIDWWSEKWVEDRVMRKLKEAGGGVGTLSSP